MMAGIVRSFSASFCMFCRSADPDHHTVVELGAVAALAIAHKGNGEAMLREETSHVASRHHLPFGEAKQMVSEDMKLGVQVSIQRNAASVPSVASVPRIAG